LQNVTNQSYLTKSFKDVSCEERLAKDIAVVDVFINSAFAIKYKQTVRLTLSDKISNIGNSTKI